MKTIEQLWRSCEAETMSSSAGQAQRNDCRAYFYAGAASIFGLLTDAIPDLPDAEAEVAMESLARQIKAFVKEMEVEKS
jgi:hypothetical protein